MMKIDRILNTKGAKVVSAPTTARVAEVAHLLAEHKIGALVVSDDGVRVAGIVSERDIVHHIAHQGASTLDQPVSAIMTDQVVCCGRDDTVESVLETMTRRRFRHAPVLEDGKMIGIVSIGDIVKARMDDVEAEAQVLRDFIVGV